LLRYPMLVVASHVLEGQLPAWAWSNRGRCTAGKSFASVRHAEHAPIGLVNVGIKVKTPGRWYRLRLSGPQANTLW